MKHTEEFKKFVKICKNQNSFVGTGYPNAKVLFVGKEPAINENDKTGLDWHTSNASEWGKHIVNNTCESLCYHIPEDHQFRKEKS